MTASPEVHTVTYRRCDETLTRRSAERLLLLVRPTGELLDVAGSGVALWDALSVPQTRREVAETLARAFHADTDSVHRDIDPVLDELERRGALQRAEPGR